MSLSNFCARIYERERSYFDFESVGLYKRMLGAKRIEKATSRWMKAYENGTLDVSATLPNRHPVLKAKNITDKELIRRQEAKIKLLELEVELLKKST